MSTYTSNDQVIFLWQNDFNEFEFNEFKKLKFFAFINHKARACVLRKFSWLHLDT